MKWLLGIFGILIFMLGIQIFSISKSAIHEILAAVIFCWSAILFSSAIIVDALDKIVKKLNESTTRKIDESLGTGVL